VSKKLDQRDFSAGFQSAYKAEVNYDMTKEPPVPIMDYDIKTKVHEWTPGWIKKRWNEDPEHPLWLPGEGYVRRPDVVIVKDRTKPPTHDNIKQVVEIKFDNDVWGREQAESYERIAGRGKLVELTPAKCSCDDPDRKPKKPAVEEGPRALEWMDIVEAVANAQPGGGRGGGRGGYRPPKRIPNPKD
jgi:hypothetical protein